MTSMKELELANKRLKTAYDDREREYEEEIDKLDTEEQDLLRRISDLEKRKEKHGKLDASPDDVVMINAGGQLIDVKRGTLCQLKGTRLEAIFSGRWDNKLQRDSHGRIFLDVNPTAFRALVDYLNELLISSEDDLPALPRVDEEHQRSLDHQLEIFGLQSPKIPESTVVKQNSDFNLIQYWLGDSSPVAVGDVQLKLLYRSSRDGELSSDFHAKCDDRGATVTVIETENGLILGAYSDISWTHADYTETSSTSDEAFLFVLSGEDIDVPCKMSCKKGTSCITHYESWGPTFGDSANNKFDLKVYGKNIDLNLGTSYETLPFGNVASVTDKRWKIKEMEVFEVVQKPRINEADPGKPLRHTLLRVGRIDKFSDNINTAINTKWTSLQSVESKVLFLEENFKMEEQLVSSHAGGGKEDIISLNVSGTIMTTTRATLQAIEDSILARQCVDTQWTDQGGSSRAVKDWVPEEVGTWVKSIDAVPDGMAELFEKNEITGRELIALNLGGLQMMGVERAGTLCLLLDEIATLKQANKDAVTRIDHSPYCMGKIIDFLRFKSLHSQGLAAEPALPIVCLSQQIRYNKVVKHYFPGDSAKLLVGC